MAERGGRFGDDRGAASWVAVAVLGVVGVAVVFGVQYGEVVVGRHRAAAAADLAAVAGAAWVSGGEASACGRAEWVVRRMGGELVACAVSEREPSKQGVSEQEPSELEPSELGPAGLGPAGLEGSGPEVVVEVRGPPVGGFGAVFGAPSARARAGAAEA
ncbi:Rv3654c family TadE-like protein [Actinosynnema sp. NPDC050436]|uniref:Rv3654c family TadE-like protein n=1 Tax=Actinosynnema sp. NPDC050436 TaxID=3155659 RepID=UPI003404CEE5